MHHCFEDIEVPAMQAGLQQPALLIDDAVDDPSVAASTSAFHASSAISRIILTKSRARPPE